MAVYELTDAMPADIHVTVPRSFRGRRSGVVVHTAPIEDRDRAMRAGVPVTAVGRTIVDVMQRSGTDLAVEAAEQALARGLVTRRRLAVALEGHGDVARSLLDLATTTS